MLCVSTFAADGQVLSNDPGWFIINGFGKNTSNPLIYTESINSPRVSLNNVRKLISNPGTHFLFVIGSDGKPYEKKLLPSEVAPSSLSYKSYHIEIPGGVVPKYLYYYIRYEEDDPPASLQNYTGTDFRTIPLSNISTIALSHKSIEQKDVLLVIPKSSFNNCSNRYVSYKNNLVELSRVFQTGTTFNPTTSTYVFPTNAANGFDNDRVYLNDIPGDFYYINFKGKTKSVGQTDSILQFNCGCAESKDKSANFKTNDGGCSAKDTLKDPHDPNYIELISVQKRGNEYYAHYHVECYNSGNGDAPLVSIDLDLPPTVDHSTVELTNWRAAGYTGEYPDNVDFIKTGNHLHIKYKHASHTLRPFESDRGVQEINKAWFEFIVKINTTDLAELNSIILKPNFAYTTFGRSTYPINLYIDHCRTELLGIRDSCDRLIINEYDSGLYSHDCFKSKTSCCMPRWYWITIGIILLLILLISVWRNRQ